MTIIKKYWKKSLLNLLGSAIVAFGIYNIHSISEVSEGGALGLTLLAEYWLGISPAITNIIITSICYLIGIKTFGKQFVVYSIFAAGGFSGFYALFELFPRVYPEIAEYPIVAALIGAVFVGVGCGICVRNGGAPTGDDALAMSVSKKLKLPIQWVYFIFDIVVLVASLSYIPLRQIQYSLLTVVISGQILGWIVKIKVGRGKDVHSGNDNN